MEHLLTDSDIGLWLVVEEVTSGHDPADRLQARAPDIDC